MKRCLLNRLSSDEAGRGKRLTQIEKTIEDSYADGTRARLATLLDQSWKRPVSLLDRQDLGLLCQMAPRLLRVKSWLARDDVKKTYDRVRGHAPNKLDQRTISVAELSRVARIGRIAKGLGGKPVTKSACLTQSLAILWWLHGRGLPGDMKIGVDNEDGFAAHAWVEISGLNISDAPGDRVFSDIFDALSQL